eukprot:scaffold434_cov186-Pinguiococcus_pyrenoidosus.AAC.100
MSHAEALVCIPWCSRCCRFGGVERTTARLIGDSELTWGKSCRCSFGKGGCRRNDEGLCNDRLVQRSHVRTCAAEDGTQPTGTGGESL